MTKSFVKKTYGAHDAYQLESFILILVIMLVNIGSIKDSLMEIDIMIKIKLKETMTLIIMGKMLMERVIMVAMKKNNLLWYKKKNHK